MTVTIMVNGNMSQFLAVTDPRLGEIKSKTRMFDSIQEVPSYTVVGNGGGGGEMEGVGKRTVEQ